MSTQPNKLSQFWQELKRRRVVHVVTVYASASFVIIELVNNLTEPLNLPPSLATIVIVVLTVGFPLAIILSWLYDLTGKGVEKTKSIQELKEGEKTVVPNAWRISTYVAFVVILGLATFHIVGGSKQLRAGDIQSLMILPIENYTGDDQLDDFISGMHSVLITDVGRISSLRVKSRVTSVAYADKPADQITAEQGIDVIVKPIIMCLADSVCFQMKAVTSEGEEIWISEYREPKSQLYNLTNSITKKIAEEVRVKLNANEERILAESRKADPDAYNAWVTGQNYWDQLNKKDLELAKMYFERAIEIDPLWAPPYAGLAAAWGALMTFGDVPDSIGKPIQYEYHKRALELDSTDSFVQYRVALMAVWTEWEWEKGERAFVTSLELNPNDARCRMYYAHLLTILRRSEEALHQAKLAVELDPLNPLILGLYVTVLTDNGRCQEALDCYEKAISLDPDHYFLRGKLSRVYNCSGDYEKLFELWKEGNYTMWERFGVSDLLEITFRDKGWIAFNEQYTRIVMEDMAKEFQISPWFFYNRYLAFLKKMNLPLSND